MHQQQPFYPDEEWEYYEGEYYEEPYPNEWETFAYDEYGDAYYPGEIPMPVTQIPDMGILIGLAILLFFVFVVVKNNFSSSSPEDVLAMALAAPAVTPTPLGDPLAFAAPYTNYRLTQGLHGQSYGHLAIDLAAGRGTPILSPINGVITGNYTDQYGNTTLIIENDVYRVLILHGNYFAQVGTSVTLSEQVGTESNNGYTTDMAGNRCYGREWCGNHTHLNVFDKRVGTNVSPLDLINP